MKTVELYARVRHAVLIEGISERAAADRFGIDARTGSKMLKFSVPLDTCAGSRRYGRSSTNSPALLIRFWRPTGSGRRSSGIHLSGSSSGSATSTGLRAKSRS
jgi:hypothetical protein